MDVNDAVPRHGAMGYRMVSRPHAMAFLWYGAWSLVFGLLVFAVFRTILWDGTMMVFVPLSVMAGFALPLTLCLRNVTAVAILTDDTLELRRYFRPTWRVRRSQIASATPTPGIFEGPLRLSISGDRDRSLPGFLMRGLRGTWLETLRNEVRPGLFANMSREEVRSFAEVIQRSAVERDESFGSSPEERWSNWRQWDTWMHGYVGVAIILGVAAIMAPWYLAVWALVLVHAGVGIILAAKVRGLGTRGAGKGLTFLVIALVPGVLMCDMYDWRTVGSGLGKAACCAALPIWLLSAPFAFGRITGKQLAACIFVLALLFGFIAYWIHGMLVYANMRLDDARPVVETAEVLRAEAHHASRSTPALLHVAFGSTPTLASGVDAQFRLNALPPGPLIKGGHCYLAIRSGWLHVRWVEAIACQAK